MWNSAQGYVPAWTGGGFGRERIPVYVWLSPFAAHLKLPQHCQSTVPQYRIKSSQEKENKKEKCPLFTLDLIIQLNVIITFSHPLLESDFLASRQVQF